MPKVSFVCPTKNRMQWLAECITSLCNQTEKDIEIIVVDDGSTDYTFDFVTFMQKQDRRISYLKNEVSVGAGEARNAGNRMSSGDIICVMDDDDLATPDRAEKTIRYFENNPDIDIVTSSYMRIGYNNEEGEKKEAEPFNVDDFKKDGAINYFSHPACAYRRSEILDHPYKRDISSGDETIMKTDDFMLVEDFVSRDKKFGIIKEVLCLHRVLPNSVMHKMRGSLE
jgi:glycosyltransferase involved in cell wall biosynthesis